MLFELHLRSRNRVEKSNISEMVTDSVCVCVLYSICVCVFYFIDIITIIQDCCRYVW